MEVKMDVNKVDVSKIVSGDDASKILCDGIALSPSCLELMR